MTTLAAWVGVDQRAPASLYIVSDSRFTRQCLLWRKIVTNTGQKIFACKQEPHLFGYYGWAAFPSRAIAEAVALIDAGQLFANISSASARQAAFDRFVRARLDNELKVNAHRASTVDFAILHAAREGSGMASSFRLWISGWHPKRGWNIRERVLTKNSEVLYAEGSGADWFLRRDAQWKDSEIGRTSRGVFSAFVDALVAGEDTASGGAPQLGGLFREGRAMEFGIVFKGKRYLTGKPVPFSKIPPRLEWFNELFERTDPVTLKRLPKAQRHARPSWTAPWHVHTP